jgi:hypothetical protein
MERKLSHDASVKLPCFCGKVLYYLTIQYLSYFGRDVSVFMFLVGNVGINCMCRFFGVGSELLGSVS